MQQSGSAVNLQTEMQLASYNLKKLKINPLFNRQEPLPKGSNSSQSPVQRSGFVGSMLAKKNSKIPSGSKYQQQATLNKAYSVVGQIPPQHSSY